MVKTNEAKVREFHETFRHPTPHLPGFPASDRISLRLGLIAEELSELSQAIDKRNLTEVADALGDILYVTYGLGIEFGLPMDAVFEAIHASNMSKLGEDGKPIYREDGKVLKGPNYKKPTEAICRLLLSVGAAYQDVDGGDHVETLTPQESP